MQEKRKRRLERTRNTTASQKTIIIIFYWTQGGHIYHDKGLGSPPDCISLVVIILSRKRACLSSHSLCDFHSLISSVSQESNKVGGDMNFASCRLRNENAN